MRRCVDPIMVSAVVIVQPWGVEGDGDGFTSGYIFCSGKPVETNVCWVDRRWPAWNEPNEMGILAEVMPCDHPGLGDGKKFGREGSVLLWYLVDSDRWETCDGTLYPDHAIHGERILWHSHPGGNMRKASIPGAHGGLVIVIQARLCERKLSALPDCYLEREGLWVQKRALVGCGREHMRNTIVVLPGHDGMELDHQDKRHKPVLRFRDGHGGALSRGSSMDDRARGVMVACPDRFIQYESSH